MNDGESDDWEQAEDGWWRCPNERAAAIWASSGDPSGPLNLELLVHANQEVVDVPASTLVKMLRAVGYVVTAPEPPPPVTDWCACSADTDVLQ